MKHITLLALLLLSAKLFSQTQQTIYVDYSVANFDDLSYVWKFNSGYNGADTALNYAAVGLVNPLAGYTDPDDPQNTVGEWTYLTTQPLIIDSVFAIVTHENNSGQYDKIIIEIVALDANNKPTTTVLWSNTDSTNTSLSPGGNYLGQNAIFLLKAAANYTVPAGQKVGINLRYVGNELDSFAIVGTAVDNGQGGTDNPSNYATSWMRYPPLINTTTKNTTIGYGSPVGSDGWFEAQNWNIWARVRMTTAPPPVTISSFTPSTVCAGGTVTITGSNFTGATSVKVGGTPVTSFTVNSATSITAVVGTGTTGQIVIITPADTATSNNTLTINQIPATPTITPTGSLNICQGQSVTLTSSAASYYTWSTGQHTQSITVSPSQTTSYTVSVGATGCTATSAPVTVSVTGSLVNASVCMVSVDPATGYNKVIWEESPNAVSYKIYKQNSVTSAYDNIATVQVDSLSVYLDPLSNAAQQSSSYKISALSNCGVESSQSLSHTTIHLSANQGINGEVNLQWNAYAGFSYTTFEIYRSNNGGTFTSIGNVVNSSFAYTDINPPAGTNYYYVSVINPAGCNPSKSVSSVQSNILDSQGNSVVLGLNNIALDNSIKVYPNPVANQLLVSLTNLHNNTVCQIYDMYGKLQVEQSVKATKQLEINTSALAPGFYILKVTTDGKQSATTFIKQ